jgi:hypothetical protein
MEITIKNFAALLLADFISGLIHWWEDRALLGESRFEFINGVRRDNELHHKSPAALLQFTWWENLNTTAPYAWILALYLYAVHAGLVLVSAAILMSFGNLIHRWAHERKDKRPRVITLLQQAGIFQSPSHHAGHHFKRGKALSREESSQRYCVMTNFVNPILDGVGFFQALDFLLQRVRAEL